MTDPATDVPYVTIAVGTDGSAVAHQAIDRAADIAARQGGTLLVVCAYHPIPAREQAARTAGLADARDRVTGTEAAQQVLADGVARAQEAGARQVEGLLVGNDAVEALLSVAHERGVDLVVIGSRGGNVLSARLLGSVPVDLSHRAPCDVLIVRADAAQR